MFVISVNKLVMFCTVVTNHQQQASGLYYKHITIINGDCSVINEFEASVTDDASVIIYDCYMFIEQVIDLIWTSSLFVHNISSCP